MGIFNWLDGLFTTEPEAPMIFNQGSCQMAATMEQPKRRAEDKNAEAEALAKAEEKKLLDGKSDLFRKLEENHERDKKGYRLECRQWGNFLALTVAREANQDAPYSDSPGKHYVGSINLGLLQAVRLIEGHAPDLAGEVTYSAHMGYVDGDYNKRELKVQPSHSAYCMEWRRMIDIADPKERNVGGGGGIYYAMTGGDYYGEHTPQPKLRTPNFPRMAQDDQIVFEGTGVTLHAPAGMGKAVYLKILKATGRRAA